jgi:hypothetical protein
MQGGGDFSLEAIGELLSKSEERYADTVMILAGYGDEMAELLKCNPGLETRFPNHYTFDDYEPLELLEIAKRKAADSSTVLAEDALALLQSTLLATPLPGNGRDVRNLLEGAKKVRDTRVVDENTDPVTGVLTQASQEDLATVIAADFTLAATPLALTATPALAPTLDGSSSAAPTNGDAARIEARARPQPSSSTPMAVGNPKPRTSETPTARCCWRVAGLHRRARRGAWAALHMEQLKPGAPPSALDGLRAPCRPRDGRVGELALPRRPRARGEGQLQHAAHPQILRCVQPGV